MSMAKAVKRREQVVTAAAAAATFLAVMWLAAPGRELNAGGEDGKEPGATEIGGVKIAVDADKQEYAKGTQPTLRLTASNPTAAAKTVKLRVGCLALGEFSMMTRVGPLARETWHADCDLALKAGESRTVEYALGAALKSGDTGYITVIDAETQPAEAKTAEKNSAAAFAFAGETKALLAIPLPSDRNLQAGKVRKLLNEAVPASIYIPEPAETAATAAKVAAVSPVQNQSQVGRPAAPAPNASADTVTARQYRLNATRQTY